jgi:hypothetical protein
VVAKAAKKPPARSRPSPWVSPRLERKAEQWLRILASAPEIEAFIRENDSKLKSKE